MPNVAGVFPYSDSSTRLLFLRVFINGYIWNVSFCDNTNTFITQLLRGGLLIQMLIMYLYTAVNEINHFITSVKKYLHGFRRRLVEAGRQEGIKEGYVRDITSLPVLLPVSWGKCCLWHEWRSVPTVSTNPLPSFCNQLIKDWMCKVYIRPRHYNISQVCGSRQW